VIAYVVPYWPTPVSFLVISILSALIQIIGFCVVCIGLGSERGGSWIEWAIDTFRKCFMYILLNYTSILVTYYRDESLFNTLWAQTIISFALYCAFGGLGVIEILELEKLKMEKRIQRAAALNIKEEPKGRYQAIYYSFFKGYQYLTLLGMFIYIVTLWIGCILEIHWNWPSLPSYDRGVSIYIITIYIIIVVVIVARFLIQRIQRKIIENKLQKIRNAAPQSRQGFLK
jgi:hypothetical protein